MTQKFELDPIKPAEEQIWKTEFNFAKEKIHIYYHYSEGKVTARRKTFSTYDLIGKASHNEMNEKETEENSLQ